MEIRKLKRIIDLAVDADLAELELSEDNDKIRIIRHREPPSGYAMPPQIIASALTSPMTLPSPAAATPSSANSAAATPENNQNSINSPMVGTFYRSPSPNSDPYIKVGDTVNIGDVLCIIEAMKLLNEITAETSGEIVEILVENGSPVEYGEPLFAIR